MGTLFTPVSWAIGARPSGLAGRCIITVSNTGTIASTFVPLSIAVSSDRFTVEAIELIAEDLTHLQPGSSMQYRLDLKREGFSWYKGWDSSDFDSAAENLTVDLNYLGPDGLPTSATLRIYP